MPWSDRNDPDTKKAARWRAVYRSAATFLVIAIVATLVGLLVFITVRGNKTSSLIRQTHNTGEKTKRALQILVDCTTPHHKCYDDAQKNQGKAVGSINQVVVLASYCADQVGNQTLDEIEACVRANLR